MLSTAEQRTVTVIDAAISEFAKTGYLGTPTASVATRAAISTAYVFKLFPTKEKLFVAALDRCFERVVAALTEGADAAKSQSPDDVLDSMGEAYARLISDRELLMLQVHAQSAADVPEIGDALRRGLQAVTEYAKSRSRADDASVQRFVAYGQLCHLIVTTNIEDATSPWATLLTDGIRHY